MRLSRPFALFFLLVFVQVLHAQKPDSIIVTQLDDLFAKAADSEEPGISVLVVKNKTPLYRKAFGLANIKANLPLTPEHIFRIGSITKQFTSTAILKLIEQGKIDLQDPITKFLPDYPMQGKVITIEHLLTHTSGIKSYTSLVQVVGSKETKAKLYTPKEMIDLFKNERMDFNPGDNYLYNNSGYFLLGAIIEKASGKTLNTYFKENFFQPLGMSNTSGDDPKKPSVATGYYRQRKFEIADYIHPTAAYAAGSIFSTVDDLWKWNQALFSGSLVNKELIEKAWTPLMLNDGSKRNYGYGWQLGRIGDKRVIGHGGTIDGFQSYAMYVPDADVFVAILSNNMSATPEEYAYRAAAMVMGALDNPAKITLTTKQLDEYVGVYAISNDEQRTISWNGDKLYSQKTGGVKTAIFPYGKDKFFVENSPARFYFIRNDKGLVTAMEFEGREFLTAVASRTDRPLPKERVAIPLDTAIFDKYVGEYEIGQGVMLNVFRKRQEFYSQVTGQNPVAIYPETKTQFFLKVVDAQLEFMNDQAGRVVSVILYQGGKVLPGKRMNVAAAPRKEHKEIKVNPASLAPLEGEYELTPTFKIVVKKENDRLMTTATGQTVAQIFPEGELKFFYKIVDAQIEFQKGPNGKITRMILFQDGQAVPLKKIK